VRGELKPGVQGELLQNVVYVALGGVGGDVESLGNLLVRETVGD
jgi:hypothetical protein